MHTEIKHMMKQGRRKTRSIHMIKNKYGIFCGNANKTKDRWGEYIEHLYEDVNRPRDMNLQIEEEGLK